MLALSFLAILVAAALLGALVWIVLIVALAYLMSLPRLTPGAVERVGLGVAAAIVAYIAVAALIALPFRV